MTKFNSPTRRYTLHEENPSDLSFEKREYMDDFVQQDDTPLIGDDLPPTKQPLLIDEEFKISVENWIASISF